MKIYIITKHGSHNYGAMLQAWALMTTIREFGLDCRIINYRPNKPKLIPRNTLVKQAVNGVFAGFHYKETKQCFNRFERFISEEFVTTDEFTDYKSLESSKDKADIYICGSDQIWNPYSIRKEYFLDFVDDKSIRMSYAASMGVSDMPEQSIDTFCLLLDNIDYCSVREQKAKDLIEESSRRKDISVHVDPVMLIDKKKWESMMVDYKIEKPYILCYFMYKPDWLNRWLKEIHMKTKKQIIVLTMDPCRIVYNNRVIRDAGPKEFLTLIKGADCVISSSFHGIALSIANGVPFYAIINPKMPARLDNLLSTFNLNSRVITDYKIPDFKPINYVEVEKKISEERQKSLSYLMSVIKNPVKPEKKNSVTIAEVGIKCTGCGCCELICPISAIKMVENDEGFRYPIIDKNKCISCGLCAKKCHVISGLGIDANHSDVYYAIHKNSEIRKASSSGGVFSALADSILQTGGLVAGAYFDESTKKVMHTTTDHVSLEKLRRSKYVESNLGSVYLDVKTALDSNRKVLFCGTPCQCAGLKNYIGENYNLILCDFFCHGVPSGKVFKNYLSYLERKKNDKITDYQFRTKNFGWAQHGIQISYEKAGTVNTVGRCEFQFVASMIDNLFLRKSCYTCDKSLYHSSDITIGDFWGVFKYDKKLNDNKGLSVVLSNTSKGRDILDGINGAIDIHPLDRQYIDYALKTKKRAVGIIRRNRMFEKYKELGCDNFIKKYYSKRINKNRLLFFINSHLKKYNGE